MKINCIHCGHSFPLSDAYDDFEGPVKCPTCRGILEIRAQNATLKMEREILKKATAFFAKESK